MTSQEYISQQASIHLDQVKSCLNLLENGATIPFIARYRKDATKGLDEVQIELIEQLNGQFISIEKRQKAILNAIEEAGELTPLLKNKIQDCYSSTELEDLYLPFKKTRKTKADKARDLGLEGLAKLIMAQNSTSIEKTAQSFIKGEITNTKQAIEGALQIIAEWMNEHPPLRKILRKKFLSRGILITKLKDEKKDKNKKFSTYYQFNKPLKHIASHQFLAIHRAVDLEIISLQIKLDEAEVKALGNRFFIKSNSSTKTYLMNAFEDCYKRLLKPSLTNESLKNKKEESDQTAIEIFSKNLRQVLLAPPLGNYNVLAIDPGFKTGCKIVCLDATGQLKHHTTLYPHPPQNKMEETKTILASLVEKYAIKAIAIGDGTAGRETLEVVKDIQFDREIGTYLINEDGASVYSASSLAREEFGNYDVSVRGTVSIGRRLIDPLSELVKIPPQSIGVGQYQHEVNQKKLAEALERVVISCVNQVGVDLNTTSAYLLSFVSGLGPSLAKKIIEHRNKIGKFTRIEELKNVPRLGEKAFEQAAGFLRIKESKNPLDNTGVHPESYKWVKLIAEKKGVKIEDLIDNQARLKQLKANKFEEIDHYTFHQIIEELKKPGRDPRAQIVQSQINEKIKTLDDLHVGQIIYGKVTNITEFGAFIDLGIKENGLIHKSNLATDYVKDVNAVINLNEQVKTEIIAIDVERKRIGLKLLK